MRICKSQRLAEQHAHKINRFYDNGTFCFRKKKAPIFFNVCPVKYDETTGKLRIADNHFIGNVVARGITHVKLNSERYDSIEDIFDVLEDDIDGPERNESDGKRKTIQHLFKKNCVLNSKFRLLESRIWILIQNASQVARITSSVTGGVLSVLRVKKRV